MKNPGSSTGHSVISHGQNRVEEIVWIVHDKCAQKQVPGEGLDGACLTV